MSRTAYAGLPPSAAVSLAERTFHIERPAWTPPASRPGTRVSRYLGQFGATEEHPHGKPVLVESTVPLRVDDRSGHLRPLSFALQREGATFTPQNPIVPISIADTPGGGISLPEGVRVVASGGSGAPAIVGDQVMWVGGGSTPDTDLMVEPRPLGLEVSWQLRSAHAQQDDSLTFRLPAGDELRMSPSSPESAEVVRGVQRLILIPPAGARQADGKLLPVSYSVQGDVLTSHVDLEGNVDFPVLLDPKITVGYYGLNGQGWQNVMGRGSWHDAENCSCLHFGVFRTIGEEVDRPNVSPPIENSFGQWYINPDNESQVKITRVDVTGLTNTRSENWFEAGIYEQPNNKINERGHGIYSWNGLGGKSGNTPLWYNGENGGEHEGKNAAFCAVEAGGHDGGEQPLCYENEGGEGFVFGMWKGPAGGINTGTDGLETAQVRYIQSSSPSAKLTGVPERWINSQREGEVKVEGEDTGTGVAEVAVDAVPGEAGHPKPTPEPWGSHLIPGTSPYSAGCPDAFCYEKVWSYYSLKGLGTGVWDLGGWSRNAVEYRAQEQRIALIDNTPPEIQTPSWAGTTLGDSAHELTFSAQDGSSSAPQSGVASMWLAIDGRDVHNEQTTCPKPESVPAPNCFALTAHYTLNGEDLAAGEHTVTIHAKDWLGNESELPFHITIVHAAGQTQQVGPGTVNLQSGDFKTSATDVSIAAGAGADLTVSRTYNSQAPEESGPLGPGWSLSLPDTAAAGQWGSLEALATGNVEAVTTIGRKVLFTANGGTYTSPVGYQTYTLTKLSSSVYQIADSGGDYTQFEELSGKTTFLPTKVGQAVGAGGLNNVIYVLKEGRTSEIVAPEAGFSCKEKPLETRGCRVLTLHWAKTTTAKAGEWGKYENQLASVSLTAWENEKMVTRTVAEYLYDASARLRAEWDPRISPAEKTLYGYEQPTDLLTSVMPPGRQPYLMYYGTTAGGVGSRWLLSVTRPEEKTPFSTKAPSLKSGYGPTLSSETAEVGTTLEVAKHGGWNYEPLAYDYRWEDCNQWGAECKPIAGATNKTYTPQFSDIGYTLVAQVVAENGYGATPEPTLHTSFVGQGTPSEPLPPPPVVGTNAVTTIEYHVPVSGTGAPYEMGAGEVKAWAQLDAPAEASAIFPPDEPQGWPAHSYENTHATVFYFDSVQRRVNVAAPGGAIATSIPDSHGNIHWTLTPQDRQLALNAGGASKETAEKLATESTYNSEGTELEYVLGPQHEVKLASGELVKARAFTRHHYDEGAPETGGPYRLETKSEEGAHVESGPESGKELEIRIVKHSYSGQNGLGWKLHKPTAVITEPSPGKTSTNSTAYNESTGEVTETTTPGGAREDPIPLFSSSFAGTGSGAGQLNGPNSITIEYGAAWIADKANNSIDEFSTSTGAFLKRVGWGVADGKAELEVCTSTCKAGLAGGGDGELSEPYGITYDTANGHLYVSNAGNHSISSYTTEGKFITSWGWGVKDGKNELETCTTSCKAGIAGSGQGELKAPRGLTINAANVVVADGENDELIVYTSTGGYIGTYGKKGNGNGEFTGGAADVTLCDNALYAVDYGGQRVEKFSESGTYEAQIGKAGREAGEFSQIARIGCDPKNGDLYVTDRGEKADHVDVFSASGTFLGAFGEEGSADGQFHAPVGVAVSSTGESFVVDQEHNRVEKWAPGPAAARTVQTIYYSAEANPSDPTCGNHPEWANLPCQTKPLAQPGDGLPELPTTTFTYEMLDQPATITATSGGQTRTTSITHDAAGRTETTSVTSTTGQKQPSTTDKYSTETGALHELTNSEGKTISWKENTLGQTVSYTDAAGSTSTFKFNIDGRLTVSFDGKGTQTRTYNLVTGCETKLEDSAAGTSSATCTLEGKMETQTFPNGMVATYGENAIGQRVSVVFKKGASTWYEDKVAPSIHGQWISQTSTLSSDFYKYEGVGRLEETQETPTGKHCTSRLFGYDEESNRPSETVRESSSQTCASSGGTTSFHAFDTANRLDDPGTEYEAFGANTMLPGADAGGHPLESSYYAGGALYSQTQNEQTNTYGLDPADRVGETTTTIKLNSKKTISHYAGSGSTPAWTEEVGGTVSRRIAGIDGSLSAIQTNSETPVIQIVNLHGDVIGTVPDKSESTPTLISSEPTAFGVPTASTSSKFGWLGAGGLQVEFEASGISSSSNGSYVPQLGVHLLPQELSPSVLQDPINEYLADWKEAPPRPDTYSEGPNGINPLPVNEQIMHEAWERAKGNPPPANGPEGGAQARRVRHLEGGSEEYSTAVAAFNHTWTVIPGIAYALGEAITISGSDVGGYVLGFVGIPGWIVEGINAVGFRGRLYAFAGALMEAGANAAPGSLVEITLFGSLKYGLHYDIIYEEED